MTEEINTHRMRVDFGKHKGQLVTRLPINYLEWHINEASPFEQVARAELKRRGIKIGTVKIEITNHAIDRASLRAMGMYLSGRNKNEGIYSWLKRIALEAIDKAGPDNYANDYKLYHECGLKLVFKQGKLYPTLVTVIAI